MEKVLWCLPLVMSTCKLSSSLRTTSILWHKNSARPSASYPLSFIESTLPSSPSLPPFGIFLVQWPPFTTITQISWAGVILSIAPRCLEEEAGGGFCVAEFPFFRVTVLSDSVLHLPCFPFTTLHCQTKKLIPPVTVF